MYCCACSDKITDTSTFTCEICNATVDLHCSSGSSSKPEVRVCSFYTTENKIKYERQKSYSGQKNSSKKMTETSNKKFRALEIGSYVYLAVPKVDRGPLDSKNLTGKMLDLKNAKKIQIRYI
ncbi:hypothetical protein RN001_015813 [Aquatica leii]|uniref:Uncharacterized protein n=1 Tax=Aquatica leii TaxID=1421715 RepID=A0AAN7NXA0_9COLE|nr:hypothetical protein RN001_015813 [Aquatica leii]